MNTGSVRTAALAAVASILAAAPAQAQIGELLEAATQGGAWVNLPIEEGRGGYTSLVIPTAGLALDGCFQVWDGHTGSWIVRAKDSLGDGRLEVTAEPGQPVEFSYRAGLTAQLDVQVEWSEPRDTTLFIWVGLAALSGDRDICQPPSA